MTGDKTQTNVRIGSGGTSYPVHLLRKKEVEQTGLYVRSTRIALGATYATSNTLALLSVRSNSFFGDREALRLLKKKIIPGMVAATPPGKTIRVWIPGCGTGEESYTIAMLFLERILELNTDVGLQIFATDIEPDAIATARSGIYPAAIQDQIPPALLRRYFKREGNQFRIVPKLRETVVFSTHNLLVNVPFSRLDLISCRNVFSNLSDDAQNSILLLFHFALRRDGILFVRAAESLVRNSIYFEPISEVSWASRQMDRSLRTEIAPLDTDPACLAPSSAVPIAIGRSARDMALQYLIEGHIPASALVNEENIALHFFGPIHRYVDTPKDDAIQDLIGSLKPGLRSALTKALRRAARGTKASAVARLEPRKDGAGGVIVQVVPLHIGGANFRLVSFLNTPGSRASTAIGLQLTDAVTDLERAVTHRREAEAQLDILVAEHSLLRENYAAALEELESTRIELQTLRIQHQATAAEYQQAADDFENILSSSGIPTLFLDDTLRVRFLSQTAQDVFGLADTDIGRSLADILSNFNSPDLLEMSRAVLSDFIPVQYDLKTSIGIWYSCRVTPYRKKDGQVKGVVLKFFDITALKRAEVALNSEKIRAEAASVAKSRFLAAASHDLRQPLQTLRILQELLLPATKDGESRELVVSSLNALTAMSGLLNTLLDINQLEAGVIHPAVVDFTVGQLLQRLNSEFTFHANGRGLELRMVPCNLAIRSDPRLLEDMIRNLLSNAMKYTRSGRVLFGCRRRANTLSIEVWDTGVGIPEGQLKAIFLEYHQIEGPRRDGNRGLGLGLAIVKKLANLLGHKVSVRSRVGHGSVFSIEVMLAPPVTIFTANKVNEPLQPARFRKGNILIVEDELDVRKSYERLLQSIGHQTTATADGDEAIARVADPSYRPDLVIADYSLPGDWNGVQLAARLRKTIGYNVPTVILTGDISMETLREISKRHLIQRSKPLPADDLCALVQSLLGQQGLPRIHPAH